MGSGKSYVSTASFCESEHDNRCLILQQPPKLPPHPCQSHLPRVGKGSSLIQSLCEESPAFLDLAGPWDHIRRLLSLDAHTPSGFCTLTVHRGHQ